MTRNAPWLAGAMAALPLFMASASHARIPAPQPQAEQTNPPSKPSVITRPDWIERPSGPQVNREYPKVAAKKKIEGRATIRCIVSATGAMTECWVISETPQGYGFGQAALRISKHFKMRPKTVDGVAVGGATVTIPIPFRFR